MDVLALILTCSVYPDDHLVRAMVELASQENPYFVGDLVTLVTFDRTNSASEAQRVVTQLERRGGRPAVGLLGLPLPWAKRYGKTTSDLFDPCVNLVVGSSVLQSHSEACSSAHSADLTASSPQRRHRVAPPEAIRQCALRRFGAELGIDGYAESVLKYLAKQRVLFGAGAESTATPEEPFCRCSDATRSPPRTPTARPARPKRPAPPPAPEPPRPDTRPGRGEHPFWNEARNAPRPGWVQLMCPSSNR